MREIGSLGLKRAIAELERIERELGHKRDPRWLKQYELVLDYKKLEIGNDSTDPIWAARKYAANNVRADMNTYEYRQKSKNEEAWKVAHATVRLPPLSKK